MKRLALLFVAIGLALPVWAAKVTSVEASASPKSFTGACPKLFEFTATITVDGPGTVTYKWIRSDGALAPNQVIEFKQAGRQQVKTTWTLGDAVKLPKFSGWEALEILTPNPLTSNRATFSLRCSRKQIVAPTGAASNPAVLSQPTLPVGTAVAVPCIDPAASEVRFEIVRRDTQFRGRVRITGVVKNVGTAPFTCNAGSMQASAHLYEVPAGATSGGTLRGHTDFAALPVAGSVVVSYERDWDSSSPSEGEFPPSYRLMVVYDPDITLDGNPANDDCKMNNNDKSRSGTEINALLR